MSTVNKTRCWVEYRPDDVIGDFGWLWQQTGEGEFGWTLVMTIEDNSDPAADEMDIATITLDDSQPPRKANRLSGLPYMPCLAPSVEPGNIDALEVTIRFEGGASITHSWADGDRTEAAKRAIFAALDPGGRE